MTVEAPQFRAIEVAPDGSVQLLTDPTVYGVPAVVVFRRRQVFVPAPVVIPVTDAPRQTINVTLGGQVCTLVLYTKSINAAESPPGSILQSPPTYRNVNPVFLDLYVGTTLVIGGTIVLTNVRIVRNAYLGFIGDLILLDTQGNADPEGVPYFLPPLNLRNDAQRALPLNLQGRAPADVAGTIPGLGSRWVLTYWRYLP